jgi:hypothetical protein
MALTVSTGTTKGRSNDVWGTREVTLLRVTLDDDYTTDGWAFDPKAFGHQGVVDRVIIEPRFSAGATGPLDTVFVYDHVEGTIFAYVGSTGAELAASADKSTTVLDVIVLSE